MKKWECTVCGYIHVGDQPPESCPVCGADRSLFVELTEAAETPAAGQPPEPARPAAQAGDKTGSTKCTVCGYLHNQPDAPGSCPVCGSDASHFTPISGTKAAADEIVADGKSLPEGAESRWQCGVCGYRHTGLQLPGICPVCGADQGKFSINPPDEPKPAATSAAQAQPVGEPGESVATGVVTPQTPSSPWAFLSEYAGLYEKLTDLMTQLHAHPISVHIPNGVLPVAVIFLLLGVLFGSAALSLAAFYNLVFVMLAMPFVLFSGYNDWQKHFGAKMTKVFRIKITCGGSVAVLAAILVIWRIIDPEVAVDGSSARWLYVCAHLIMLGAAVTAGYFGGKLIKFPGE